MEKTIKLTPEDQNFSSVKFDIEIWGNASRIVIGKRNYHEDRAFDVIGAAIPLREAKDIGVRIIEAASQLARDHREDFMKKVRKEAKKIDPNSCDVTYQTCDVMDPYGIHGDVYCYQVSRDMFVRNKGSDFWVHQGDIRPSLLKIIEILQGGEPVEPSDLGIDVW